MRKSYVIIGMVLVTIFAWVYFHNQGYDFGLTGAPTFTHGSSGDTQYVVQKLTLTADASSVSLDSGLIGGYLFNVELISTLDDVVTFQIHTYNGTPIINHTTSSATTGEWATISDRYAINGVPTYTLSGLGSGSLIAEITVAKK